MIFCVKDNHAYLSSIIFVLITFGDHVPAGGGAGGLTTGSSKDVSPTGGCDASSWIIVSMTGFAVFGLLGAGGTEASLTEHTELSKPKYSVALRFLFVFDVENEAIDDVADDAATEEAFDVLNVAEDFF